MRRYKTIIGALLVLMLVLSAVVMPAAAQQAGLEPYIQRMIQYYLHYRQDAETEISTLLQYIRTEDPGAAVMWESIMEDWGYFNEEMIIHKDVLPDGLPQDDSLCIVILGFGLNDDGSMKEELIDRLVVGLASAMKYPNAYVAVTGGATADNAAEATEAGQMAAWLRERGIEDSRLIVESRSLSTTENALHVYEILNSSYPQVSSVAVVSSDYHIAWGSTLFATVSHYRSFHGGRNITVGGNAANTTGQASDTLYSQAWGISIITGVPFDGNTVPAKYWEEETVTLQTTTPPEAEEVEQKDTRWLILPTVLILLAGVILVIPTKKKKQGPE